MKKILITGAPGFAASHLVNHLLNNHREIGTDDIEIHGTKRVRSDMYRLEKMGLMNDIKFHLIEMTDAHSVRDVLGEVLPDEIYHLAAQDYVKSSWQSPSETFDTNVGGLINLYLAIRDNSKLNPKVLVTSTSEIYGYHTEPIHEFTEQNPLNPYGVSKMTMDHLAQLYSKAYGIPTVVTRAFNITGWGRNDPFVDSTFAKQIAVIEKYGGNPVIKHGNLGSKRTFFDVKDAVRGYYLAMNHSKDVDTSTSFMEPDHWWEVFCFGRSHSTKIETLLDILISLSMVKIEKESDPSRFRPIDTSDMVCNPRKAKKELGWEAEIPLKDSLEDLLNYWRERV